METGSLSIGPLVPEGAGSSSSLDDSVSASSGLVQQAKIVTYGLSSTTVWELKTETETEQELDQQEAEDQDLDLNKRGLYLLLWVHLLHLLQVT